MYFFLTDDWLNKFLEGGLFMSMWVFGWNDKNVNKFSNKFNRYFLPLKKYYGAEEPEKKNMLRIKIYVNWLILLVCWHFLYISYDLYVFYWI